LARSALALAEQSGDKEEEALVWMALADELGGYGDPVAACKTAMGLFQAVSNKPGEASALISLGYHNIDAGEHEDAIRAGKSAQEIYKSLKDNDGGMLALKLQIDAMVAKGDGDEALRLAQEKRSQCNVVGDLAGEAATIQMIIEARMAMKDMEGVQSTALKSIDFFESIGSPELAAHMWLLIAKCKLEKPFEPGNLNSAKDAAEKGQKMFSDLEMYEYENEATKIYQEAHSKQTAAQYLTVEKEPFYYGVRARGIQYGPQYRANNIISGRTKTGIPHTTCSLMLHGNYDAAWEEDVQHHPALIDAGGHSAFSQSIVRPPTEEEMEIARRTGQADTAAIPYMMVKGTFNNRRQRNNLPMWMNVYFELDENGGPMGRTYFWQDK